MRIEVLYTPGCPNYLPAVERIEKVWHPNRCGQKSGR